MQIVNNHLIVPNRNNLVRYIEDLETCPLSKETVSRRHLRILIALYYACESECDTLVHATTSQIQEAIEFLTKKRYSIGDINSFTHDLHNRGYAQCLEHDFYGRLYAITEDGIKFLEKMWSEELNFFENTRPFQSETIQ